MLRRIPVAGSPLNPVVLLLLLISIIRKRESQNNLKKCFSSFIGAGYLFLCNSGLSSVFVILESFKNSSARKEVILPAYTAHSLIVAIEKAGLKPVLCDISMDDFNMDTSLLPNVVSRNTLCILGVHMFGIVARDLEGLKDRFPGVFIIEDCAQSLGSKIKGCPVGNLGDISFFSFNRGKNLPTYGGGCIATNSTELGEKIKQTVSGERLAASNLGERAGIALKILGLSVLVRPRVYGTLYPLISRFKEVAPPEDFEVREYTSFQAAVASFLLGSIEELSKKRHENGMKLIEGLKDLEDILLPGISNDTLPAFNRLPVVFKDLKKRGRVEADLWKAGIETSRMYIKPLHHVFDLGYEKDVFPNATYFAEHVLTLPTHPLLSQSDLETILRVIRNV